MGAKPRKIQLQSAHLKVGNFKGVFDDLPAFAQPDALSNDMWLYQGGTATHEDVMLRNGDLVIKTVNDKDTPLTAANLAAGKWKVVRHLTDGEIAWLTTQITTPPPSLKAEVHLVVDTDGDPGANYNTTTKRLEIGVELQEGDNINIYVNNMKYTYGGNFNAIDYLAGETWVVWIPSNVGFDLVNGDQVEIEIYR
jgi:hypothetical protein